MQSGHEIAMRGAFAADRGVGAARPHAESPGVARRAAQSSLTRELDPRLQLHRGPLDSV